MTAPDANTIVEYNGIKLDLSRDELFSVQGKDLISKYYTDGKEGVQKAIARAANAFSYGDKVLAQEVYDAASSHWFFYSSPVLSNAPDGHWDESVDYTSKEFWAAENTKARKAAWIGEVPKAMPIACFLTFLPDTIEGQLSAAQEISRLSVAGGGTSLHNDIRAVSDKAPGPIPYFKTTDGIMGYYRQGKTRRGSCAIYMDVSHPDIIEFINMRKTSGGDPARKINNRAGVHHGVNITRAFKDAVNAGGVWELICPHTGEIKETMRAKDLWEELLAARELTGEPYLYFIDVANDALPVTQKNKGLKNRGSNLCFTGDTLVAVADGRNAVCIKELAEASQGQKSFQVYSAKHREFKNQYGGLGRIDETSWVSQIQNAVAFKTGTRKVIQIVMSDGSTFKCTPDHQLALSNGKYVEAQNSLNLSLEPFFTSLGDSKKYRHINTTSNGHAKQHIMMWKFANGEIPKDCHLDHINNVADDSLYNIQVMSKKEHLEKTAMEFSGSNNAMNNLRDPYVTSNNMKVATFLYNNARYKGITNLEIIDLAKQLFIEGKSISIKNLSALDLRVPASFSKNRFGGSITNLIDIVNGKTEYSEPLNLEKIERKFDKFSVKELFVTSIIELDDEEDVYDLTVENNHNFYIITKTQDDNYLECSGVLVHNCSEITLATDVDRSAVCALSSVNLEYYEHWKNTNMVSNLVRFVDNIIQWYIDWASDMVPRTKYSAMMERAIGIGAMGWHNFLMSKDIPFESGGFNSASQWNHIIFKNMHEKGIAESIKLGTERGEAPDMIGTGRRNSHVFALAPNSNSSVLCNTSSAMEPIASNGYAQKTRAGIFLMKNRFLERKLEVLGKNDAETWKLITDANGSVQQLDFLSEKDKLTFKTAWEIDQHWIIQHAGDRQQFVCQAQSCNLFFMPGTDRAYINSVHLKALREEKIKSLYYFRTGAATSADVVKEITRKSLSDWKETPVSEESEVECISCQG